MSTPNPQQSATEPTHWLDKPSSVAAILRLLYVACAGLLVADLVIAKHGPFAIEHWLGFYAVFGFLAYVAIVMSAKLLRRLVMRAEDYYDR